MAYTLHTVYDAVEVDDRFWLTASNPAEGISPGKLGKLSHANRAKSIVRAKQKAAKMLGIEVDDIQTAKYLS